MPRFTRIDSLDPSKPPLPAKEEGEKPKAGPAVFALVDETGNHPAYYTMCADSLIQLNLCRRAKMGLTFECNDQRHAYEQCEYEQYKKSVKHWRALTGKEEK